MKVVVAMSGGVDSSVAALLLARAGHDVVGLFMKNWNEPASDGRCQWEDDVADALSVCERIGIPINTVDLSRQYWEDVFTHFLAEYRAGRTPNPDVLCNREIKFKAFLDQVRALGGERIATGHYARVTIANGRHCLLKGVDPGKDQSYFLYTLGPVPLAASMFPVGALLKADVRRIARAAGLQTHAKKDSTGICFIGERPFREFIGQYLPAQPGEIRDEHGRVVGNHLGVCFYTLGQRKGLGIGGVRDAPEAAWYVIDKVVPDNVLIVGQGHEHPALMSMALTAESVCWTAIDAPAGRLRCRAKTRYRQADQACTVEPLDANRCWVRFEQPQRAVTPGQSVVFYDGERCLGGGIIAARHRTPEMT